MDLLKIKYKNVVPQIYLNSTSLLNFARFHTFLVFFQKYEDLFSVIDYNHLLFLFHSFIQQVPHERTY